MVSFTLCSPFFFWHFNFLDLGGLPQNSDHKDTAKARRMILKGVRDHIVPKLHGKETPFHMWKALIDLFESNSDARKLALKEKLMNT